MLKKDKWKTKFIIVALGQAISMLGSHGVQFALIWWLAEKTSSPLILGISGIVAYLPMSLFSPIAGIAADRYNRKFISIFSDTAMGTIALLYAVLLFFFDLPVWTVFIMLCVRGIGSTFQQPAIQSIIPQLVPKDQLVKTNGWMQLLNSGSFLLGPVIGASLYAVFSDASCFNERCYRSNFGKFCFGNRQYSKIGEDRNRKASLYYRNERGHTYIQGR